MDPLEAARRELRNALSGLDFENRERIAAAIDRLIDAKLDSFDDLLRARQDWND